MQTKRNLAWLIAPLLVTGAPVVAGAPDAGVDPHSTNFMADDLGGPLGGRDQDDEIKRNVQRLFLERVNVAGAANAPRRDALRAIAGPLTTELLGTRDQAIQPEERAGTAPSTSPSRSPARPAAKGATAPPQLARTDQSTRLGDAAVTPVSGDTRTAANNSDVARIAPSDGSAAISDINGDNAGARSSAVEVGPARSASEAPAALLSAAIQDRPTEDAAARLETASAVPSVGRQEIVGIEPVDGPAGLATKARASADASPAQPGEAADFMINLAGSDKIALNVSDAAFPADIETPMRLDEAVAFALSKNHEAQAAVEKLRGAFWDKMGAYAQYAPSIEANYANGAEESRPASYNDASGTRVLRSVHHRYDRNITVRQPIIDLAIIADILSGRDREKVAEADTYDVKEGIAFDVVSAYLSVIQARLAMRLAEQYKNYLDDLDGRMKARVEGGGATAADLDRIRGRLALAEAARVEALGDYQTNMSEFKRLTKVVPAQLVIPDNFIPSIPETSADAMERALRSNPSYLAALAKVDQAADDRNKSFAGLLPKVSAQMSKMYSYNAGGAAEGNPVDGVYPSQATNSWMLVAQWSLNGGTSVTSGMASAAKVREFRWRSMDVRARVEQGVQSGYTAINAATQREQILRKSVESNRRVVDGFEEQYRNGNRSLFDVLDSYEQLYNSRLNLMRVTVAKAKAAYQIRRLMGELGASILKSGES